MKGNNTIIFSHDQMKEMIQDYIDRNYKLNSIVDSVKEKKDSYGSNYGFEVQTSENPKLLQSTEEKGNE
jgi:hypothetical protein